MKQRAQIRIESPTQERWACSATFLAVTGMAERTFYRNVKSGKIISRENAAGEKEFVLPGGHSETALAPSGSQALSIGQKEQNVQPRHYTAEQLAVAEQRAKMLAPARYRRGTVTEAIERIAQESGLSTQTIWRYWTPWVKANFDLDALVDGPRKDCGRQRSFENRPELQKFVAAKWFETGNVSHVRDIVKREWPARFAPLYGADSKAPRYTAIHRFVGTIPRAVSDAARLPKQQADARNAPYFVTGRGEWTHPNQCWVADHRLFDVLVVNDIFPQEKAGAAIRVWQTLVQDMRTRVIVGIAFSADPSWRPIASALQQGISRFGKPELFYCDNGKDFRKVGEGARRGTLLASSTYKAPGELDDEGRVEFEPGLLARLEIKVCYCTPRHPQAKEIESYFNFVSRRFDPIFFRRGHVGSKPAMRTEDCGERQHAEYLAGKRSATPLLLASEFVRLAAQWTKEYNETHHHTGRGMDGKIPLDVMNELLPAERRQIPDMLSLAPLFWDVQIRKVANCKVQIDNATYSPALNDPEAQAAMYLANGTEVAVHRDPGDLARALVFEHKRSGALLAKVECDELLAQAPLTADHVSAMSRQRTRERKASRDMVAALTFGVPSEIDLLSARATGTDDARPASFRRALPPTRRQVQPAIIGDAAAEDFSAFEDAFKNMKFEE